MKNDFNAQLKDIKTEKDALDQSIALNRIVMAMLDAKKREDLWLRVILIISLLANVVISGMFLYTLNDMVFTETITTITQDTEGEGNNVYQSGDKATYIQEGVKPDGEADGDNSNPDGNDQERLNQSEGLGE